MVTKKDLRGRLEALRNDRSSWLAHWEDLAKYVSPRGYRSDKSKRNDGSKLGQEIIDNTATLALRTLASGIMAGLTSPARPWFKLAITDTRLMESERVKLWIDEVENIMRETFSRSNLYQVLPMVYMSLGAFGTGGMLALEDDLSVVRYYPLPTGSFLIGTSHRHNVDTVYREFSMTVKQIVDRFGIENCSDTVKNAYEQQNYNVWIDVVHVIEPNTERQPGKIDGKNKPFTSWIFEEAAEEGQFLYQGGFEEFPGMFPRWQVTGEDVYGTSPAMDCLGDVKQLQLEQKRKIQAIDKMVNPPMVGDSQLRNQRTSLVAGDITYISGLAQSQHAGFRPVYEINPRILELSQDIAEVQNRIKRALYEDLMLMFAVSDNSQMTAREVEERHQEKLLVLGPVMERLNEELLDPLIDRTFAILVRKGMIPEAPREIQEQPLKIEYISLMAQAQKLVGISGIERLISFVGNLSGAVPSVLDKVDFDQSVDEYANMLGVSPKVVVSDDKVAAIRQQKAQQMEAQQMAERMGSLQQGAAAAKLLSETDTGALQASLGGLLGG